jgi:ferric-dicitrate binding protein FerR (iron transport regulator)
VYRARHALRQALQSEAGIAFTTSPNPENLDWAPLPLYEAGKLASPAEERAFERWMLQDPTVSREIVEFASFAHALRAGALQGKQPSARTGPKSLTPGTAPPPTRTTSQPAARPSGFTGTQVAVIGGLAFVAVLLVAMVLFFVVRG